MVTLTAVLQSQSVELAGNRCDPATKARHSDCSNVSNAAGAEQLLPQALMSAGGAESQASVHLLWCMNELSTARLDLGLAPSSSRYGRRML